jgi:hypothetical protein
VLTAGIVQLAVSGSFNQLGSYTKASNPQISAVISQCIADLDEMASLYHFAKIASSTLQYIVDAENVEASLGKAEAMFRRHPYTAAFPADNASNGFRLPQDKTREFTSMHIGSANMLDIANPPLWLFATQSRPTMDQAQDLEQFGFSML